MHREPFSPNTGDTTRNLPTGIRPYGRSWQRPGVTPGHWPAAPANPECPGGFLAARTTGRRPAPRYTIVRTSRLYRLQRTRGDHGNLGRRSRRAVPASSRRAGRKVIHDYPRHFPEFLPLASSRRRPAGSRAGAVSRRDTGRRRGPGAQAGAAPRHDRHGPNPRTPAQIRSNVPRGATRSSTAGYFILHRIKVT
jgi:hypothetical protein